MDLFFISSRLHWPERGLFTTPALTSAKGLTLLCSSVLMLWVSHLFLSFCLPLELITFACFEDSCSGRNLSWTCKLATQNQNQQSSHITASTANSHVVWSLLGCLPASSFQPPPQRGRQTADWLVHPPRCGSTITTSLTCLHASLSCSNAFIHLSHHVHSGHCETPWLNERCQPIAPLGISTFPVPIPLMEWLRSGQIYCLDGTISLVKGTGASYNVGQCHSDNVNDSSFWAL